MNTKDLADKILSCKTKDQAMALAEALTNIHNELKYESIGIIKEAFYQVEKDIFKELFKKI